MEAQPQPPKGVLRTAAAALLIAAAVLGVVDAALALWHNRAIAPHASVPLCLTAPFVVWLVLLAPLALLLALVSSATRRDARAMTSALLALGFAAALLRVVAAVVASWRGAGDVRLADALAVAALPLAVGAGLGAEAAMRALLARCTGRRLRILVALALGVHLAAAAGVAWLVRRESHGVIGDVLAAALGLGDASDAEAAPTRPRPGATPDAEATSARARPAQDRPATARHLVLVTIDTLRADHLEPQHMPEASALAAAGTRFRAAYSSAPWTLPALASLLTGLPAARHGAGLPIGDGPLARSALPEAHATLATVLQDAGFETRAIVTNPYLGLGYGLGRGFARFENVTLESEALLTLQPTLGFWLASRAWPQLAISDRGAAVTSRAARFLRARTSERRLFLWLHYVDPHAPYDGATRSFRDDLLAGPDGVLPRMAQLRAGEIRPDATGRAALRAAYERAVRAVDHEVGDVLRLLDASGLGDDAVVVLTADHGEELWDHGGVEHGHTLYDELIRVPLVIRCPGCPRGVEVAQLVGIEALAATLLELLGVAPPAAMSPGFAALLRGAPYEPRPVVSENLLFAEERVALRTERFTYVAWPNGKEELYDRVRDPHELRDLAARTPLVRRHREQLARLRVTPPDVAARSRAPARGDDDRTRRALRALGYVQ